MSQKTKWCTDPDKAFDLGCRKLGVEESCLDDSACVLEKEMKTYISIDHHPMDQHIDYKMFETKDVVLEVAEDKKSFKVIKHRYFPSNGEEYHISYLKNILMAGQ